MRRPVSLVVFLACAVLGIAGGSVQAEPAQAIPCEYLADGDEGGTYCPEPPPPPPPPPPEPPPPPPNHLPYGWHGEITWDGYARGWACDPNDFNYPISVHFYANDGNGNHTYIGQDQADDWWNEGVAGACGGNPWHGYSFRIPNQYWNGHTYWLYTYAINIGPDNYNPELSGSPVPFTLYPPTDDEKLAPTGPGGWSEESYTDGWQYMTGQRSGTDMTAPGSTEAASGCRTVRAWHTGKSWLGRTLYRFHQVKRFCWRYPHITFVSVATEIQDVDTCCIRYNGVVNSSGWYYTWRGVSDGGHYSFRQADIGNCVARYGCLASQYPWVKIWINGNGTWTGDHGT